MAIRNKKYIVRLDQEERESLRRLVRVGKAAARKITRARMLLKADAGTGGPGWTDQRIAETLEVGVRTVENLRRCCVEEGLEVAIVDKPRPVIDLGNGSWLDIAEIELNVLGRQCLDRRIPDKPTLVREISAWESERNAVRKPVNWQYTTDDARIKLKRLYPQIQE